MLKKKENNFKVIIIAGPTASGKSSLAIDLAKKYNGIIINADSQQIYKELPILSSQPNKMDYKIISHKLFSFLNFYQGFSVEQWFNLVKRELIKAKKKKSLPIIVGGTGMYLNTLINGIKKFPKIPTSLKKKGREKMKKIGPKKFYEELKKKNKLCVYKINPNDKIRLLRSWEIFNVSKKSIFEIDKERNIEKLKSYDFFKILIFPSKEKIYSNCSIRWKNMIKSGAIKETQLLMKKEVKLKKKNLIKTIGFQQIKNFLIKKNNDIEKSSELAIQATRNYAKRQFTWFRHQFKANVTLKKNYDKKTKKYILKEINDKLLTN